MKITLKEIPPTPVKPDYKLELVLTHDEICRLGWVVGNISGGGPTRELVNDLYRVISDIVKLPFDKNTVKENMHLTGN